jgi:hypothetical protein
MSNKSSVSSGSGFVVLLFLVLLVLKLTGVVDWSWWLVTAPLWGTVAISLFIAVFMGGLVAIFTAGEIIRRYHK